MRNGVAVPARPSRSCPAILLIGLCVIALPASAGTRPCAAATEDGARDLYVDRMTGIADRTLSPVFQTVTRAAASFQRTQDLPAFARQLESSRQELLRVQTLLRGLHPPPRLLVADHYIRSGVQRLLAGMGLLLDGMSGKDAAPPGKAMETLSLGAGHVVKGYGRVRAQAAHGPAGLAHAP